MNEPKPFASLGPRLLARKGGARPAMRPQMGPLNGSLNGHSNVMAAVSPAVHEADLEDLGWNDMGEEQADQRHTPPVALTPAPQPQPPAEHAHETPSEPEVRRQQRAIAATISGEAKAKRTGGRRAAFTLRLDPTRHLKLRLACTVKNRSAQVLVSEALDRFLAEMPEIEALAGQLQRD